jgi:hypothetical protein
MHYHEEGREKRKFLRIIGYAAVGVAAVALLALLIRGMRSPSESEHTASEGKVGDVWIDNTCYEKRRDLTNILFIAVEPDATAEDIHPYADYPQAAYLAILSIDTDSGTYFLTTLDTRLKASVDPVNEFGEVEDGIQTLGDDTNIGLAQAFGDGGRRSCMNTVRTVEQLLNVIITDQVCIRLSDVADKPLFLTDPLGQLQEINSSVLELMNANTAKTFAAAISESVVYTNLQEKSSFEDILSRMQTYSSVGTYYLDADATASDVSDLSTRLFLVELPDAATRKDGTS